MSTRPVIVVTDHLIEAGVERPILDAVADLEILHTTDETQVACVAPRADVFLVFHDIKLERQRGLQQLVTGDLADPEHGGPLAFWSGQLKSEERATIGRQAMLVRKLK